MLSLLEKSGITLEFIEKNKLLSKAESLGAVGLLVDRCAPPKRNGFVLSEPQKLPPKNQEIFYLFVPICTPLGAPS